MKKIFIIGSICVVIGGISGCYFSFCSFKKEKTENVQFTQSNVALDKEWVINFDHDISKNNLDISSLVYIENQSKQRVPVSFKIEEEKKKILIIKAPKKGYQKGQTYDLYINKKLDSVPTEKEEGNYHIQFSTIS